jgi:hypothetical protein
MIAKGFKVEIKKESTSIKEILNNRIYCLKIKSNDNAFVNGLSLMTKQELGEVAKAIINFISKEN